MTNLDVFRLSAEGCKCDIEWWEGWGVFVVLGGGPFMKEWNPFTNAEQDRECARQLLARGYAAVLDPRKGYPHQCWHSTRIESSIDLICPFEEFYSRALSELVRREKEKK